MTLNNLAELYDAKGNYARAEPLYQRALAIYKQTFGPEHPDVAMTLNNLAELYREQGDYARAKALYQRALASDKKDLEL
jgi:tetratricopeptide (TPR) repeat protein